VPALAPHNSLASFGPKRDGAAEKSLSGKLGEAVGGDAFGRLWVEVAAELIGRQETSAGKAVERVEVWSVKACAFAWVHRHSPGLVKIGQELRGL
jgi:hypothetical protein